MTRITKQYYNYYVRGLLFSERDQNEQDSFIDEKLYKNGYFMKELIPFNQEEIAVDLQDLQINFFDHTPINNQNTTINFIYVLQ